MGRETESKWAHFQQRPVEGDFAGRHGERESSSRKRTVEGICEGTSPLFSVIPIYVYVCVLDGFLGWYCVKEGVHVCV